MSIVVEQPGALSLVQDAGRFGLMQYGVTQSGAMDSEAYAAANELVGNPAGAAEIEMTLMGMTCLFSASCEFALTGADMDAKLDGISVPRYQRLTADAGQRLTMGMAVSGCRAYLAVKGGIDVPVVMGSRSTNLRCKMGGFEGRALQVGDELKIGALTAGSEGGKGGPGRNIAAPPRYPSEVTVRAVAGPQEEYFTEAGKKTFFETSYQVLPQSDRMGMRLSGPKVESCGSVDIISDGILFGSVQITNGGEPIIMMADHQTTGGYAKIATVCSFDLPKLAQLRQGDRVRFERVSVGEAQRLLLHPEERRRSERTMQLPIGSFGRGTGMAPGPESADDRRGSLLRRGHGRGWAKEPGRGFRHT